MNDAVPPATPSATSFLAQTLRLTVSDGRVVQGCLEAVDRERCLVLSSASDCTDERVPVYLGVVVVPGAHIVKCEMQAM